ncbi:MAG: hypothetical protein LBD29_09835 [Treponema sp.]|jgi:hypothetical protein|nr:hypothetical protein [Treponema sp.]
MANKKFQMIMLAGLLAIGFGLTGCTTFQASGLQMGLEIDGQKYEKAGEFSEKKWTNKFLGWSPQGGTLFNLSSTSMDPKIREIIERNIKNYSGDGAVNVQIKYGSHIGHWLLQSITAGIWMPGTVTVSGTVVKAVH